jgi:glycogen debranching enzyme
LPEGLPASHPEVAPYYIYAVDADALPGSSVLKHGDAFGILNRSGNIVAATPPTASLQGVVFEDTRYLSGLSLTIDGAPPMLLSSTVTGESAVLEADLSNSDIYAGETLRIPRGSLHIRSALLLGSGGLFQTLDITNYDAAPMSFGLEVAFGADFVDLFELRGATRTRRGTHLPPSIGPSRLVLAYRGLDAVERRTEIDFDPKPAKIAPNKAHWQIELPSGGKTTIKVAVHFARADRPPVKKATRATTLTALRERQSARERTAARIETTNPAFNNWLNRARDDLAMLITETPYGPYPYAGVPWFSTAFGRDGIITAMACLWVDPSVAGGTLRFLAANQATERDPRAASEPGKILHETRKGEMAALQEIPYGKYYGSVDSTPLFLMLADAYQARTGDLDLIRSIWPQIVAAAAWIGDYGDADADGFIEYGNDSDVGLTNQGWKDSGDAIFHRDGRLAEGPIALVEVQAYCHAAYVGAARLARLLGHDQHAALWARAAFELQQRFDSAFWCEQLGTYAIALDRDKNQCQVRASNAGHVLFAGLATPERARRVADTLMSPQGFCEWGIRTVAEGEARYNPMSYHNGGVWPHDNALIAAGFARYGLTEEMSRVMTGMFDAATLLPSYRLPELFCGFARRDDFGPIGYPVACIPQAWSTAAVFALLGAAIGISFDAESGQINLRNPVLPDWLSRVEIANLRIGSGSVDLSLERQGKAVSVNVNRRDGRIAVTQTS